MKTSNELIFSEVQSIDSHRNGVSGDYFHVAIAMCEGERMLVVRFDRDIECDAPCGVLCAAFNLDKLCAGKIEFGINSYRGDRLSVPMDKAINAFESENKP